MNTHQCRFDIKSLLLGTALGAIIMFSVAATTTGPRTTWEYRVVTGSVFQDALGKEINKSVAEGWDSVSASGPNNEHWGMAVLKRETK